MSRRTTPSDAPPLWRLGQPGRPKGAHVMLVPGVDAPLLPLDLPDRLGGMAREKVAERLLSAALGTPLQGLEVHPFLPAARGAAWRRAIVADARALADWRAGLAAGCVAVLPDYLSLPCAPGVWSVQTEDKAVLVRIGLEDGFAAEPDMARAQLMRALADQPPRAILRLGPGEPALDDWLASLNVPVCGDLGALAKAGFKPLRWAEATRGVNLKDPPSALYDRLRDKLRMWRLPVAFLVLALAAYLGTLWLETDRYRAAQARDAARARDLVRQHFVPEGPILDVRAQVAQVMAAATRPTTEKPAGLPPLIQFQRAAPVLAGDGLHLQKVEFRADTGLITTVNADDFATLDALVADLRAVGFLVEVLDQRSLQSGGATARLRLLVEKPR